MTYRDWIRTSQILFLDGRHPIPEMQIVYRRNYVLSQRICSNLNHKRKIKPKFHWYKLTHNRLRAHLRDVNGTPTVFARNVYKLRTFRLIDMMSKDAVTISVSISWSREL